MTLEDLKPWDAIYNVSFDRFLKLTVKKITFEKHKRYTITHVTTEEWNNVFINSGYKVTIDSWLPTLKEAEEKRNYYIEYNTEQINKHKNNIQKLWNSVITK